MKKFNFVDLFILVFVVAAVFVFLKYGALKKAVAHSEERKVRFECLVKEQPKEIFDALKVGDKLFAQYREQPAEIISIETFREVPEDEEDLSKLSAKVVCEARVLHDGPYMQLGGQEVKAGIDYILKTREFAANSLLTFVEVMK